MNLNKSVSKIIAAISIGMAKKACGAASYFGSYQPKEPKAVTKIK